MMEETGLPLSSKQRAVKSLVSQLIPLHIPLHSRPSSPPCISSFACHETAVLWGPLSQQCETVMSPQATYIDAEIPAKLTWGFDLFEFLLIVSFLCILSGVRACAVPALSQHLAQGCCFGCFSATTTCHLVLL